MAERTKAQIAAGHRRRLKTIAEKLRVMAAEWSDIDEVNGEVIYRLADNADATGNELYTEEE